ncbi:MAG: hypothetical protein OEZ08_00345 [Betaproteobacteria bacterium]|nr:hypothetical protein [Betaproteobacteria bacterium]
MKPVWRRLQPGFAAALLVAVAQAFAAAPASPLWMLMGRHGECAEIAVLERKIPHLGEIRDPAAFAQRMRARGRDVVTMEMPGGAVEVTVPGEGLALVFVPADRCRRAGAH